jgi:1-phosphofructokinase family hexose kinase
MSIYSPNIIAVSLNPSIDKGLEVPDFKIGAHQRGRRLYRRPGGKAINLARTLGKLKIPTMLIGFIGKAQQDYFEHYVNSDWVSCQLFANSGKTRENITIIDPVNRVETHIRDVGFEVSPTDINRMRKKLALLAKPDTLVAFSGSLPPGLSIEDFLELVQICEMNKARVVVDCSGKVLKACEPLGLWMIKPNTEELAELTGQTAVTAEDIIAAGRRLKEKISVVLASAGQEGAYLFTDACDLRGKLTVDPAEVKNTVGAGDAMLAGYMAGVVLGKNAEECLADALATAAASITAKAPGEIKLETMETIRLRAEICTLP